MKIKKSIIALAALAAFVPAAAFAQVAERQSCLRSFKERMDSGKELTGAECAQFITRADLGRMYGHPKPDYIYVFSLLNELYPIVAKLHEAQKLLPPNVPPESVKLVNDQLYEWFNAQARSIVVDRAGGNCPAGMYADIYLDWLAAKLATLKTPEAVEAATKKSAGPAELKAAQKEIQKQLASYYIVANTRDANTPPTQARDLESSGSIDEKAAMPPLGKLAPQMLDLLELRQTSELWAIINVLSNKILYTQEVYSDAANRAKLEAILKAIDEVLKLAPETSLSAEPSESVKQPGRRSSQLSPRGSEETTYLDAILKELEDSREELKAIRKELEANRRELEIIRSK